MATDQYEHQVGYELRDRYGRRQLVVTTKHAAPAATDIIGTETVYDADGREQIVLVGAAGTGYTTIKDEGVAQVQRDTIDFQGAGVAVTDNGTNTVVTVSGAAAPDATTLVKGIIQLAGDLAGTAAAPTVPNLIPKTLADAKGDLLAATANDTFARLAVGTDGQQLVADSTQASGLRWATRRPSYDLPTFAITGAVTAATLPGPFIFVPSGVTKKLLKIRYVTSAGSVAFKLQKNGVDIAGFTGLSATTTATTTDPADVTLADNDYITCVISSSTGGTDLSVTLVIEES